MHDCFECVHLRRALEEAEAARKEARRQLEGTLDVREHERLAGEYRLAAAAGTRANAALRDHEATHQER